MVANANIETMPVVRDRSEFDARSGNRVERFIFNNRLLIILACVLATLVFGFAASKLAVNASYEKMLPQSQQYIRNYLDNRHSLRGLGNAVLIDVENTQGDIYDYQYLQQLQKLNDAIFLIPGVDRAFMKSLWTPTVRWTVITEFGFKGGAVMPDDFDGSPDLIKLLRTNVARASLVGSLVANNQKSSTIFVPLQDIDPETGGALDYATFARRLNGTVEAHESDQIRVHIVGFAELVGKLIAGLQQMVAYFIVAAVMATLIIFGYTRCMRSTALVIACSGIAVLWQLGIIHLLGYVLDPYSVLVPFLIFAIGVSHGAQKMNGIMQDIGRGTHRYVAARYTFRRLFLAGLTALLADVVSFAVLMIIDIPVIRDLAMTASIGVAVLIFTNLMMLPVLLSYTGVNVRAAQRSLRSSDAGPGLAKLAVFTRRKYSVPTLVVAAGLAVGGYVVSLNLKIGDLDAGAPELRSDSKYNLDSAFISEHYGLSSDQFVVIVKTKEPGAVGSFPVLTEMDRLEQSLRQLPSVQTTTSAASLVRLLTSGSYEGSPKWLTINRDQSVLAQGLNEIGNDHPELLNKEWSVGTVIAYLKDHKAETLEAVVARTEAFADEHSTDAYQFLLAAGNAGIEAATNITVEAANRTMLLMVYAAVTALCFITFRSWRAVVVAVVPLILTSILCEALMVVLGIGVKVATLPVIALGVGVGVDYALYLLSVQLAEQRMGASLEEAYSRAVGFTGKVVALVGLTLAAGVITWAWSPIKFQADMGILLTFMFVWNMLGALVLIPALSSYLLVAPFGPPTARHPGAVSRTGAAG